MTTLDRMQEALQDATIAAARYRVAESQIEGRAETISKLPPTHQAGYMIGAVQRNVLNIAAEHHAGCRDTECRTCAAIRNAVTTVTASLQVMVAHDQRMAEERILPDWSWLRLWRRAA